LAGRATGAPVRMQPCEKQATICITSKETGKTKEVILDLSTKSEWTVGRHDPATVLPPDIVLMSGFTSRIHAKIYREKSGQWYVEDQRSTAGTWMPGQTDRLQLGRLTPWKLGTKLIFGRLGGHPSGNELDVAVLSEMRPAATPMAPASATRAPAPFQAPCGEKRPRESGHNGSAVNCSGTAAAVGTRGAVPGTAALKAASAAPAARSRVNGSVPPAALQLPRHASAAQAQEPGPVAGPEPPAKRRQTLPPPGDNGGNGHGAFIGPAMPPTAGAGPVMGPELPPSRQALAPTVGPMPAPAENGEHRQSSSGGVCSGSRPATMKCDKCDGPHPTANCPHFRKSREDHKDARENYGKKHSQQMGENGGKLLLRNANMIRQPGDGSCLFHSLCFGLSRGGISQMAASELRREIARFIERNPQREISGDTLEEWVRWDAKSTVSAYAKRMAVSGWGGGIEMAACSLLKKVNVHVYECRRRGEFERISCFDSPEPTKKTINVLYQGGMHYDALLVPGC